MAMLDNFFVASPKRREISLFSIATNAAKLRRQRLALKRLSDDQLKDIGITRDQANSEAARGVWDAPSTWQR